MMTGREMREGGGGWQGRVWASHSGCTRGMHVV